MPETVSLEALLRKFQKSCSHMLFLVDEYGVVSGMITLENVIEELVGPIEDEFDIDPEAIVRLGPNRFEVDAACPPARRAGKLSSHLDSLRTTERAEEQYEPQRCIIADVDVGDLFSSASPSYHALLVYLQLFL